MYVEPETKIKVLGFMAAPAYALQQAGWCAIFIEAKDLEIIWSQRVQLFGDENEIAIIEKSSDGMEIMLSPKAQTHFHNQNQE